MRIFLNFEMEVGIVIRPIGNARNSDGPQYFPGSDESAFGNSGGYVAQMRIERHVSVGSLEPYLISPVHVEIEAALVFSKVGALYETVEIPPSESFDRPDNDSFGKRSNGSSNRSHQIPPVMNGISRGLTVRTWRSRNERIVNRHRLSRDGNDVSQRLSFLVKVEGEFRPEGKIGHPIGIREGGEFFGNARTGVRKRARKGLIGSSQGFPSVSSIEEKRVVGEVGEIRKKFGVTEGRNGKSGIANRLAGKLERKFDLLCRTSRRNRNGKGFRSDSGRRNFRPNRFQNRRARSGKFVFFSGVVRKARHYERASESRFRKDDFGIGRKNDLWKRKGRRKSLGLKGENRKKRENQSGGNYGGLLHGWSGKSENAEIHKIWGANKAARRTNVGKSWKNWNRYY